MSSPVEGQGDAEAAFISRSRPAIVKTLICRAQGLQNLHPGSNPGGASNFISKSTRLQRR
jgi:hypothetical protein